MDSAVSSPISALLSLTIGGVRPPPYTHLALRPRVWAHCASTGQEVSGVVLQPSQICIHTYTYMLTARAVYICGALHSSRMD